MVKRTVFVFVLLLIVPFFAMAGTVNLAWDVPSDLTGITGYKIYWGTASATYTQSLVVPGASSTTTSVTNLAPGIYFFAAKSLAGTLESASYSNEVSATITPPPVTNLTIVSITAERNTGGNKATIAWTTNLQATGMVEYGPTTMLGKVLSNSSLTLGHTFQLVRLDKQTVYYYRVTSRSADGQEVRSNLGTL